MNVRLLRRVAKHILAEPKRLNMNIYADLCSRKSPCGTEACIAGWATLLAEPRLLKMRDWNFVGVDSNTGADHLQLNANEVNRLFFLNGWPPEFQGRYRRARGPKDRAKIAAARIEHFIQTEGRE